MAGGGLGGSEQLAMRGGSIDPYLVIARRNAPKQSMLLADVDCFAALAMTIGGRVRETAGRLHHGNRRNGTLYTGVTSNLPQRAYQHRESLISGFTARYGCKLLVWYEVFDEMLPAIAREKQIKGGSREK